MTTNCSICDEKLNLKNHKLVSCLYCEFGACKTCYHTFLPDQTVPKCMNRSCGREWTRRFLKTTFSTSFLEKDWKQSREKIVFDRETALLPASQEILERRLIRENVYKDIAFTKTLIKNTEKFYMKEFREKKIKYTNENTPTELQQLRIRLQQLYNTLRNRPMDRTAVRNQQPTVKNFVRGCPSEDCRGFLSSDWKCGLCKVDTCSKCHVIKNNITEHTCNPDDVATATLLNKDTKPCPKCHTGIFKIDGCDQMWCTQCHTAFSWKTGDIETRIHNPHYYEWQRSNNGGVAPRVAGDVPVHQCGQDQPLNQYIYRHITGLQLGKDITILSGNIIRDVIHLRDVIIPEYRPPNVQDDNLFLENRIRYLKKEISKENFIKKVLMENKKREIHTEIRDVLQMFVQASTDIIYQFLAFTQINKEDCNRLKLKLDEIETLRQFTNEALKEIFNTYKYTVREISFINHQCDNSVFVYRNIFNIVEKK